MIVKALSVFLIALIPFFFNGFYNSIIDLLNTLIAAFAPAAISVVGLFPPNPCGSLIAACSDANLSAVATVDPTLLAKMLSFIAWVMPMEYLANLVGCGMMSVMCYFIMAPLARWFKLIT